MGEGAGLVRVVEGCGECQMGEAVKRVKRVKRRSSFERQ